MRVLTPDELDLVSGGFQGTKVPFVNRFIPGPVWPGGAPGAWMAMPVAYATGSWIGGTIYDQISETFGMSTGEALFYTVDNLP